MESLSEKQMENIIVQYPEELLGEKLTLKAQQFKLPHGRRPDLLFIDRHGRHLIIELQKGVLDEKHMIRMVDYYGDYKIQYPDSIVRLMFIANSIPPERKEFIRRQGFEYKEISIYHFQEFVLESGVETEYKSKPKKEGLSVSSEDMNISIMNNSIDNSDVKSTESILANVINLKGHLEKIESEDIAQAYLSILSKFNGNDFCIYADNPKNGQVYFNRRSIAKDNFFRCFSMFVNKSSFKIDFPKSKTGDIFKLIEELLIGCHFPMGIGKDEAREIDENSRWTISFHSFETFEKLEKHNFFGNYLEKMLSINERDKKILTNEMRHKKCNS